MRLRMVRNLRRGDRILIDEREIRWLALATHQRDLQKVIAEVTLLDTADALGYYGLQLTIISEQTKPRIMDAVWPGDDLVELA